MVRTIDAPADTTMMRIVHDALRRDLGRAATALSCRDATPAQRRAIGGHLRWMMGFLHAHHASEDAGLYPLVRERAAGDPQGLDVLDRMTRDHEAVAVEVAKVEAAAAALAESGSDDVTRATAAALDGLGVVLLPHLREEENEAMTQLAFEGHWLIDGATDVDRAAVVGLVPPVPRFLLLHALAGPYRRRSRDCWEIGGKPKRRVQLDNTVTVTVSTDIHEVWEVVSDVTRVGEWSHECLNAQWLGSSTSAVPGARFRGRNRAGMFRWGRVCEIVSAEPYELVWFTVPTVLFPDSSEWRITLDRVVGGTRIAQQFHVLRAPKVLSVLYALLIPAHRDRTAALIDDLERLATVAMGPRPVSSRIARSGAEGVS
jgi:hypothetical protein